MTYRFGDIVLVPFPFTHQIGSKKRPAMIVSGEAYNRAKPDVVVMAITSRCDPARRWVKSGSARGRQPG